MAYVITTALVLVLFTAQVLAQSDEESHMLEKRLYELISRTLHKRGCDKQYSDLKDSGMCKFPKASDAKNLGVDSGTKQKILKEHNKFRAGVSPAAADMQKMYWDDEVAKIAQHYAENCPTGHDNDDNRKVPGYGIVIGQNMAWGIGSWEEVIKAWYDEVKDFNYGTNNDLGKVGHFTQVVKNDASRIGCGYAFCPSRQFKETYVCNYVFGNPRLDIQPVLGKPYTSGGKCGECKSSCQGGLCDCKGLMCLNGGTIDLGSCKCKCTENYKGTFCETADCKPDDKEKCGGPYGFGKDKCTLWMNVPDECPNMCGKCSGGYKPKLSLSGGGYYYYRKRAPWF